jgi:hypothetical protein
MPARISLMANAPRAGSSGQGLSPEVDVWHIGKA